MSFIHQREDNEHAHEPLHNLQTPQHHEPSAPLHSSLASKSNAPEQSDPVTDMTAGQR